MKRIFRSNITRNLVLLVLIFIFTNAAKHPVFLSVTNVEYNNKEHRMEISCKIFTNDLESTLKKRFKTGIDLLHPKDQGRMDSLLNVYLQEHLKVSVDGKSRAMEYLGYEQIEDGIFTYYQISDIQQTPSFVELDNTILYDYQKTQSSIMHVTVEGKRKSSKLVNPEHNARFEFK